MIKTDKQGMVNAKLLVNINRVCLFICLMVHSYFV